MFAKTTQAPSPIILTDYRNKADQDRDTAYGGMHVLHDWHIGRAAFGGLRYLNQVSRWALFNAGHKPTERQRNEARHALLKGLRESKPTRVYVIPNETGTQQKLPPSLCWQALGAPDSAGNMRGTCWPWEHHTITPLYPNSPVLKQLQQVQQTHWLRRWQEPTLRCAAKYTVPDEHMFRALMAMAGATHIALDIETMTTGNLITAIGLSDGRSAVSLPYDTYRPYQHDEDEPGYKAYGELGKACAAAVGQSWLARNPRCCITIHSTYPVCRRKGLQSMAQSTAPSPHTRLLFQSCNMACSMHAQVCSMCRHGNPCTTQSLKTSRGMMKSFG